MPVHGNTELLLVFDRGNPRVSSSIPLPIPAQTHTRRHGYGTHHFACRLGYLPAPCGLGYLPAPCGLGYLPLPCGLGYLPTPCWLTRLRGICIHYLLRMLRHKGEGNRRNKTKSNLHFKYQLLPLRPPLLPPLSPLHIHPVLAHWLEP